MQVLPAASSSLTAALGDISSVVQPTVTSVYSLVLLAIGIPLAFYLVRKVISLIPKR